MRVFISFWVAIWLCATTATAATYSFGVVVDSITGPGQAEAVGLYIGGAPGDAGTLTTTVRPEPAFTGLGPLSTFATFPGTATGVTGTAGVQGYDPVTGILTDGGQLGGLTGPFPDFFPAPMYQFIYQGAPGLSPLMTPADYDAFMSGVSGVVGYIQGTFQNGSGGAFTQRLDFSTPNAIPLPAGAVLLLSGLGLLAVGRHRRRA